MEDNDFESIKTACWSTSQLVFEEPDKKFPEMVWIELMFEYNGEHSMVGCSYIEGTYNGDMFDIWFAMALECLDDEPVFWRGCIIPQGVFG